MRDRRNTFEVGEGLLYKGEEERIEQEEQYPEKRDFCFLWCHIAYAGLTKKSLLDIFFVLLLMCNIPYFIKSLPFMGTFYCINRLVSSP